MIKNNSEIQTFLKNNKRKNFKRLDCRKAFYGGRTNVKKFYKKCGKNETIRYLDYTSLYPYVQKNRAYPIGHPIIIRQFEKYKGMELLDFVKSEKFFGLVFVKFLAPKYLKIPVIPTKLGNKKIYNWF